MSERKKLARDIFEQAIELQSDEERAAFLERACGADHSLRAEVQLLLTAHPKAAGFMEPLDDATRDSPAIERAGAVLGGRFKLLENIGEGGMGSVWVAEQQQPVKRRVAIKLVKAGMDSKQVLARFESERQALAVMDHPNIAKVFDGGMTEQGRPYFVMEYVKGVPFTDYCNQTRLPLRERLNLFILVCQAVQHAHHKGIVHRDLKPSNILICLYDGKPVPKVIDFGLAKAMHQSLTDKSIYTGHGMMVGTPLYMSPEQAEHNNLDVDTRTDIYSLGVILYELLTGSTPLERQQLQKAAIDEVLRLIKEVEPQRPSIRLSGSENLPSIAAQRSIDPRELRRTLAGDLDWIVMKSLEKERSRRYETPNGMARDIERFLNDEAVEACPPSRTYRLKKYIRKHRVQVIAGSAVLLAVLIGIVGIAWGLFRAVNAEQAATKSEQKALTALAEVTTERVAKDQATLAEVEQRAMAQQNLLAGILRPIGFSTDRLDQSELNSLNDWSALGDSRLQLLTLETAFDDPETALRIARRAERVIQACVGLSPTRRAAVIELVSAQQRDPSADPRNRIAACWLALELGSADLPALEECISWLSAKPGAQTPHAEFAEFLDFLTTRVESLPQVELTRAGDALISVLEKPPHYWPAQGSARKALLVLAPMFSPEQASRCWNAMIVDMASPAGLSVSDAFVALRLLTALSSRLLLEQLTLGADALIAMIEDHESEIVSIVARAGFVALAPRLPPEQLVRGWDAIVGVAWNTRGDTIYPVGDPRNGFEIEFSALATQLPQQNVTQSWDAIMTILETRYLQSSPSSIMNCLEALAPRLPLEQVTRSGDALIALLEKSKNDYTMEAACNVLVTLTPRLSPEQSMNAWNALIAVLNKSTYPSVGEAAGKCFAALGPQLMPDQVSRGGDAAIAELEELWNGVRKDACAQGLAALAPRMSSAQVTRSWEAIIARTKVPRSGAPAAPLIKGLSALAPRVSPEQAAQGWDALIAVLIEDWATSDAAGDSLLVLAQLLPPEQIARRWESLIAMLKSGTNSTDSARWQTASEGLSALSPRLSSEQITRSWDALIKALYVTPVLDARRERAIVTGLTAVGSRLAPEHLNRSGDLLIGVLEKSESIDRRRSAANGLAAILLRLSSQQQLRAAKAMLKSLHAGDRGDIVKQLAGLVPLLDAQEHDSISTAIMTQILDDLTSFDSYFMLRSIQSQSSFLSASAAMSNMMRSINESRTLFRSASAAMSRPKSLADLLSHPGCVEVSRQCLLLRFEELVFHDGKHVFLDLPKPDSETQESDQPQPVPPPRRFHNLHDAAAWIQQNWPDFDLETNHPLSWRGGR